MGLFDEYEDPEFGGARRAKRELSRGSRQRLSRVARRTPEVMVKVTGKSYGGRQLRAHMDYMSRKGELALYTSDGRIVENAAGVDDLHKSWIEDVQANGKRKTRLSTNIALSMPRGDPKRVLAAAQDFAGSAFSNHDYFMALHTDTDHPHVHLTIRNLGHDGKRLHMPKGRTQEWRETFAASLRSHGIEAEATSRAERGVVKKGESQTVRHIRERKTPNVDYSAVRQARESLAGRDRPEPWRSQILERQHKVRARWRNVITDHQSSNDPATRDLAKEAAAFVRSFEQVETRNDALMRVIREHEQAVEKGNER